MVKLDARNLNLRRYITVTVKVKHLDWWKFKLRLAVALIHLACHLGGFGIVVED